MLVTFRWSLSVVLSGKQSSIFYFFALCWSIMYSFFTNYQNIELVCSWTRVVILPVYVENYKPHSPYNSVQFRDSNSDYASLFFNRLVLLVLLLPTLSVSICVSQNHHKIGYIIVSAPFMNFALFTPSFFFIVGFMVFCVMTCLGEMATYMPSKFNFSLSVNGMFCFLFQAEQPFLRQLRIMY